GLHGRDDVSDWLAAGNRIERLVELTAQARYERIRLTRPPRGAEKLTMVFEAELKANTKLVLLALLHRREHDGGERVDVTKVSAPALAYLTGLHRVTVQHIIADLRNMGILHRHGDQRGRSHIIVWDILAGMVRTNDVTPLRHLDARP